MLLIGNIMSFIGCILMILIGVVKEKKRILTIQSIQFCFMAVANFSLGAISGTICNVVSIIRNLVFSKWKGTTGLKLVFMGVQIFLTAVTWNGNLIEVLPLCCSLLLTWSMDIRSDLLFKCIIIFGQVSWGIYDLYYRNYTAFVFDCLATVSNLIGLWRIYKDRKAPLD